MLGDIQRRMRIDAAHDWLSLARHAHDDVRRLGAEVEALEESVGIKGTDYSAVRVSSSSGRDTVHRLAMLHSDAVQRYHDGIIRCLEAHEAAAVVIDALDSRVHREVLSRYYLRDMSIQDVADDMMYSKAGIQSAREEALLKVHDIMPMEFRAELPKAY